MQMKKSVFTAGLAVTMSACFALGPFSVSAQAMTLKEGMKGSAVTTLQKELKSAGYLNVSPTGYYGDLTETAVKKLQKRYGLQADGIAGDATLALLHKLLAKSTAAKTTKQTTVSRGTTTTNVSLLKKGMKGSAVTALQKDLIALKLLSAAPTGYYGSQTTAAVKKLQKKNKLPADGVAGKLTLALIDKLRGRTAAKTEAPKTQSATLQTTVSRGGSVTRGAVQQDTYLLPWFGKVETIFQRGDTAVVHDIKSGLEFNIKRTYGYNHADCEPLTLKDTQIMRKIYGGEWSWSRRPVIVEVDGYKIAASMAGMPHAGLDDEESGTYVGWRSAGYGSGTNLDAVKDNEMDGHFDIHFYGSKTHGTDRINAAHQNAVKEAAEWAEENY